MREGALACGFLLLVAIAAFTVVLPELADEPATPMEGDPQHAED